MTDFPSNCWYVAGFSEELPAGKVIGRKLLGEDLALFRTEQGKLGAIEDICPHRFAPLHRGYVESEMLVCGYHGLGFAPSGACVHNPQGPAIGPARRRTYAVAERSRLVWLWNGVPEEADPEKIPALTFMEEAPEGSFFSGHLEIAANFELIIDNVLDLTHSDYLHKTTLGAGRAVIKPEVEKLGDETRITWKSPLSKAPGFYRPYLPENCNVATVTYAHSLPPSVVQLGTTLTPEDGESSIENLSLHAVTPETALSSHYFYFTSRSFAVGDNDVTQRLAEVARYAFEQEDQPMLEAVQRKMGSNVDILARRPISLPADEAALRTRKVVRKLIGAGSKH